MAPAPAQPTRRAQRADDDQRQQQEDRHDDGVGLVADLPGRHEEHRLHAVDHGHRLGMVEPEPQELVVHVAPVAREERTALAPALRHDHQRIDRRQPEQHQRQRRAERHRRILRQHQRQRRDGVAQELAAAIAHEDARGIGVEAQEAEDAARRPPRPSPPPAPRRR